MPIKKVQRFPSSFYRTTPRQADNRCQEKIDSALRYGRVGFNRAGAEGALLICKNKKAVCYQCIRLDCHLLLIDAVNYLNENFRVLFMTVAATIAATISTTISATIAASVPAAVAIAATISTAVAVTAAMTTAVSITMTVTVAGAMTGDGTGTTALTMP